MNLSRNSRPRKLRSEQDFANALEMTQGHRDFQLPLCRRPSDRAKGCKLFEYENMHLCNLTAFLSLNL